MKFDSALGFHGVVFASRDPEADARRWSAALGLPILRKRKREIVLGAGPELFVAFVKSRGPTPAAELLELHLAVRELRGPRRRPDPLGGDSVTREINGVRLVVREFRRPPARAWRSKRR